MRKKRVFLPGHVFKLAIDVIQHEILMLVRRDFAELLELGEKEENSVRAVYAFDLASTVYEHTRFAIVQRLELHFGRSLA